MQKELLLKANNISKSFPGVKALDGVSFELYSNEVFALLGENGAGKSTFIKVLSGIYKPDGGTMELGGKSVVFNSPKNAFDCGICVVHQELNYVAVLSIAENIMMSGHPVSKLKIINWSKMYSDSSEVLKRIGLDIDPRRLMDTCTVAEKQQIEIAKALYWKAKVLILDEPTSALNNAEVENLMTYLDIVKKSGVAIVYISHKLDEIFRIADRVGILRDGQHIATLDTKGTNAGALIELMVGRTISDMYPKQNNVFGDVVMEVSGLSNKKIQDISFAIKKGEILGIYGLMGSGHIELGQMLFGDDPAIHGTVRIDGKNTKIASPYDALLAGLAYVPSERKTEGLVLIESVLENIVTVHYQKGKSLTIDTSYDKKVASKWIEQLRIKTPDERTPVSSLSGGNQQKVVLAKWLEVKPKVLIMVDPTRGIDVGSKAEIYQLLDVLCAEGICIIMITSEMAELLAMSDRVIVMHDGRISAEIPRDELSQVKVVSAAIGGRHDE